MPKSFSYIKLHDDMPDHPKVEPLSDQAFRTLVTCWCWCRKHKTDGRMPLAVWVKRKTPKVRAELVTAGLVHVDADVVCFHNYLEWQNSADELDAAREQRRSAGRAGGLAKAKRAASGSSSESLSESPSEIVAEKEKELEEKKKNTAATAADLPREDVEKLCGYFMAALTRNDVKASITAKWRTEARLMLDKDKRDPAEIRAVIDWATSDGFWRANIMSVPTLREKYDRLRLAMEGRRRPVGDGIASQPDEAYSDLGIFGRGA